MNLILKTKQRYLVSLTPEELTGISNALNELCHGVHIDDAEFQTRLGITRSQLTIMLEWFDKSCSAVTVDSMDVAQAWSDGASVQVRVISASGDPVDMSAEESRSFAACITRCADEAEAA